MIGWDLWFCTCNVNNGTYKTNYNFELNPVNNSKDHNENKDNRDNGTIVENVVFCSIIIIINNYWNNLKVLNHKQMTTTNSRSFSTNSNNSSVLLTTNLNPSLHLSNSNILRINHPERFRLKKIISDLIEIFKNKSTTNTIDITFSDEITLYINGMDLWLYCVSYIETIIH